MTDTRNEKYLGHYISLSLHRAMQTADLQFSDAGNTDLLVTIPARDLLRLRNEIDRKLEKATWLTDLDSKKE